MSHGTKRHRFTTIDDDISLEDLNDIQRAIHSGAKMVIREADYGRRDDKYYVQFRLELEWK